MNLGTGRAYLILLLVWFDPGSALASAQARSRVLPVDEMVRKSDVIGVATVQSATPRKDERTGIIRTDYNLVFSETWKGTVTGPFVMWKAGGRLGDQETGIAGHEYTLAIGEQLVVFSHPSTAGDNVVIGLRQGMYRIGPGPDRPLYRVSEYPLAAGTSSTLTLQMLKDEVSRALGRPIEPTRPAAAPPVPGTETSPSPTPTAATQVPAGRPLEVEAPSRAWAWVVVMLLLVTAAAAVLFSRKSTEKK